MEIIQLNWIDHILALLFAVVIPLFAVFKSQPKLKKIQFNTKTKISVYLSNSISLWIGAIIIVVLWLVQGRTFEQIGLSLNKISAGMLSVGLISFFILAYLSDLLIKFKIQSEREKLIDKWQKDIPFLPSKKIELKYFYLLALSAGVCEEIIFRGFLINYFVGLFGNETSGLILAVLLPGLIFALSHIYQGWNAVFKIILMAVIFGALFILMKSLWPLIILHTLVDVFSGMAAYSLLSKVVPEPVYMDEEE